MLVFIRMLRNNSRLSWLTNATFRRVSLKSVNSDDNYVVLTTRNIVDFSFLLLSFVSSKTTTAVAVVIGVVTRLARTVAHTMIVCR